MTMQQFNQVKAIVKGERFEELLNDIHESLLNSDSESIDLNIRTYLDKIPEGSPAATTITIRFKVLDEWYDPIRQQLDHIIKNGDELDRYDALQQKQYMKRVYQKRQYYILKRVHQMYKLYEDDSLIDYPL